MEKIQKESQVPFSHPSQSYYTEVASQISSNLSGNFYTHKKLVTFLEQAGP